MSLALILFWWRYLCGVCDIVHMALEILEHMWYESIASAWVVDDGQLYHLKIVWPLKCGSICNM